MCDTPECRARWQRLERYARAQQRRLRLDHLPSDVVALVCAHLSNASVCALVAAMYAAPHAIRCAADLVHVPPCVRDDWVARVACDELTGQLKMLMSRACFHCRLVSTSMIAVADWSAYRRRCPQPLAEYGWWLGNQLQPEWRMHVHHDRVRHHVRDILRRGGCATRISLYCVINNMYIQNAEVSASLHYVSPHYLCGTVMPPYVESIACA